MFFNILSPSGLEMHTPRRPNVWFLAAPKPQTALSRETNSAIKRSLKDKKEDSNVSNFQKKKTFKLFPALRDAAVASPRWATAACFHHDPNSAVGHSILAATDQNLFETSNEVPHFEPRQAVAVAQQEHFAFWHFFLLVHATEDPMTINSDKIHSLFLQAQTQAQAVGVATRNAQGQAEQKSAWDWGQKGWKEAIHHDASIGLDVWLWKEILVDGVAVKGMVVAEGTAIVLLVCTEGKSIRKAATWLVECFRG
jgi:hypothetical protein